MDVDNQHEENGINLCQQVYKMNEPETDLKTKYQLLNLVKKKIIKCDILASENVFDRV